ncbi:hypothetical protein CVV38_01085 [Candidatus Peregrinibacteria bacterium HGW-Peregrinibacteria-1]|jgi:predicted nucleic acid-binding Zn ribbon protein|nr:MAG: hypothetical protein CVV38_01085 [Candidatus Peregrinibacteria bacterium HGW-Peregrinibacteria-1]
MFTPLQKYLPKAAAKHGIARELTAATVCYQFKKTLSEIFPTHTPQTLHEITTSYESKSLTVYVPTSGWAQEINIRKEKIQTKINTTIPDSITKITIKLRPPSPSHTPES